MKKYFLFKFSVLLAGLCGLAACNESDEGTMGVDGDQSVEVVDSLSTGKVELVRAEMSTEDSTFFASLLPVLSCNSVMRIDSREDFEGWLPDSLTIPEDMDFDSYTYVVGRAELCSPSYFVKRDTLVYTDGRLDYQFDYFYSPTREEGVHLICGKFAKLPNTGGVSLSVDGERGIGMVLSLRPAQWGPEEFKLEDKQCALIRWRPDFQEYIDVTIGNSRYQFLYNIDFRKYSIILWKRETPYTLKSDSYRLVPLSPKLYRFEVRQSWYFSVAAITTNLIVAEVIDKVPDDVEIIFDIQDVE